MTDQTFLALDALLTRFQNLFSESRPKFPYVEFDSPWLSECIIENGDKLGSYYWQPVKRENNNLLIELESALEFNFHKDIHTFYGSYWSNGICVERDDINFNLIQIWNEEDEIQLKENLLGHIFAKIKSKLPISYFIGCTFGDEIICLDHESGKIVLEKPGYKAHKILANDLATFLISLQPNTDRYNI